MMKDKLHEQTELDRELEKDNERAEEGARAEAARSDDNHDKHEAHDNREAEAAVDEDVPEVVCENACDEQCRSARYSEPRRRDPLAHARSYRAQPLGRLGDGRLSAGTVPS